MAEYGGIGGAIGIVLLLLIIFAVDWAHTHLITKPKKTRATRRQDFRTWRAHEIDRMWPDRG